MNPVIDVDGHAVLNLIAGAPLAAVAVAIVVLRKFAKLVRRLVIVGMILAGVLAVNNYHLFSPR